MSDHIDFAFNSSSDDDVDGVSIPEGGVPPLCEGIPRRLWMGKCVVLYKNDGVPVARGICRNVSYDVVIGTTGPLGDSHIAVQISSSLSLADVPDEWRYSIRAWPVEFIFCNGASFRDHELRAKYNSRIALLSTGPVTRKSRPYTSTSRNPPPQCQQNMRVFCDIKISTSRPPEIAARIVARKHFQGRRSEPFVNGCT